MLTGVAVGAGIMLTYLALFGLAGHKLRSVDHEVDGRSQKAAARSPRDRR